MMRQKDMTMSIELNRRRLCLGASGLAASLLLPSWSDSSTAVAAPMTPLTPERGLAS